MVLCIGGVLMAYFLKVTKQQSRTYLSIYESFYSPETKSTKHHSYRSLGRKISKGNREDSPISIIRETASCGSHEIIPV